MAPSHSAGFAGLRKIVHQCGSERFCRNRGIKVVGANVINADALHTQIEEIKLRTKLSIETSTRLIHESSCLIQKSYRNLYRVNRSSELPEGILKTMDSLVPPSSCGEPCDDPGASDHGRPTLHCEKKESHTRCDYCDGILLDNKAYHVRTEDDGKLLLDMIVCHACNLEAQNLGIKTVGVCQSSARAPV
jgi:hypothetical protein